jgi:hypothetical protein
MNFIISLIIGSFAMSVLGVIPIIGPIASGVICSLFVKDMKRSMISGFLSGTLSGIFAGIIITAIMGLIGLAADGTSGGLIWGFIGSIIGGGIFISSMYFGILGLIGGAIGSSLVVKQ